MQNALRFVLVAIIGAAGGGAATYFATGTGSPVERTLVDENISVCSFNIQFLGNFKNRADAALANVVDDCDIVAVQELVAPPRAGVFPNGDDFRPDPEAEEFFAAMEAEGFSFVLSEEDTGTGDQMHVNSSATEWFVTFFKPDRIEVADDLPTGFLAADRYNNDDFERVPYAFGFRTVGQQLDFVLISVHLKPDPGPSNRARRAEEMAAIAAWIDSNDDGDEQDFIILGDMNFQNRQELIDVTPAGFVSLNSQILPTNTRRTQSYDHVMVNLYKTAEIDLAFGFVILDLRTALAPVWDALGTGEPYPGEPYDHNAFRSVFSDHNPVVFKLVIPTTDDD